MPRVPFTNHRSALNYADAVDTYICKELRLGSLIGPFTANPLPNDVIISPLQSVAKKNTANPTARRIVVDLSFPKGKSVNDGIPRDMYLGEETHLTYPSVDNLIRQIQSIGPGCLIFKVDSARAFRQLLFLCPRDLGLCAFAWREQLFLDIAFPFGLRSACLNCQRVADAICRIYRNRHGSHLVGYIDDFAAAQPHDLADEGYHYLITLLRDELGIELSMDKCMPPSTHQIFLGLELDTVLMSLTIPQHKLDKAAEEIRKWRSRTSSSKKQLQSLLGLLIHITSAVVPGRRFVARLIDLIKLDKQSIVLDHAFKLDLRWWDKFMTDYNGRSLIQDTQFSACDSVLATDSCLTGMGAMTSKGHYCHALFPEAISKLKLHISALELLVIVVACRLWGHLWPRSKLVVRCDNEAACHAVNNGRSCCPFMQAALRNLWLVEAQHSFTLRCIHIAGIDNIASHCAAFTLLVLIT